MLDKIFIDTAAFIALADIKDMYHKRASSFSQGLETMAKAFTSESVLVETYSNLQYHLGGVAARKFLYSILSGESGIELIIPAQEDLFAAYRILKKYEDQKFSLVDGLSFVLMERMKITNVFTFDHHFRVYRPVTGHFQVFPH
ncbi:MAG: PIN domain-containing protein [Elusimicrobia bacterium]|nr:PIN domain-containing protein [Elusimicrobiota bacterium]